MEATQQQGGAMQRHHEAGLFVAEPPTSPLSPAAALANARWTPTKEQIAVLDGLYRQGLRTPTAEQIQQITARLREHGHIEGKNVFYWFQNHKARQRQKQKQQSFDYFSKLFRRPPPLPVLHRPLAARSFPLAVPPAPATACSAAGGVMYRPPSFIPAAANAGYYPQHQTPVIYPGMEVSPHDKATVHAMYLTAPSTTRLAERDGGRGALETLQLFPLQPTFVLPADQKPPRAGSACAAAVSLPTPSASSSYSGGSESSESPNSEALPFYDFFGVHSGGR